MTTVWLVLSACPLCVSTYPWPLHPAHGSSQSAKLHGNMLSSSLERSHLPSVSLAKLFTLIQTTTGERSLHLSSILHNTRGRRISVVFCQFKQKLVRRNEHYHPFLPHKGWSFIVIYNNTALENIYWRGKCCFKNYAEFSTFNWEKSSRILVVKYLNPCIFDRLFHVNDNDLL